jgi:hypothetical protein
LRNPQNKNAALEWVLEKTFGSGIAWNNWSVHEIDLLKTACFWAVFPIFYYVLVKVADWKRIVKLVVWYINWYQIKVSDLTDFPMQHTNQPKTSRHNGGEQVQDVLSGWDGRGAQSNWFRGIKFGRG